MSAGRRYRRNLTRNVDPPDHIRRAADKARCPDCDSDVKLTLDTHGTWHVQVAHDHGCVQLAWRERHGATAGLAILAGPGETIPPDLITDAADLIAKGPAVTSVRIATDFHTSRTERDAIDRRTTP